MRQSIIIAALIFMSIVTTIACDNENNQSPTATITTPQEGDLYAIESTVAFIGTGSDPDGTIFEHSWDFGDGETATGDNVTHSYDEAGTYVVTFTVIDDDSTSDTDNITITIEDNYAPTAIIISPEDEETFGKVESINFTGTVSDPEDGPLTGNSLVWTSSIDGQIGTGESFFANNLSEGTHIISLTATDSQGGSGSSGITIYVQGSFRLESQAFTEGENIPEKFSCAGDDISPDLQWFNAPEETKSFALIVDDPDAPGGTFVHWVLYDIPASLGGVEEGFTEKEQLSDLKEGKNDFGLVGYGGPCPPPGSPHRYFFKLYALDVLKLDISKGETKDLVETVMEGHILAEATLIGKFGF